MQCSAIVVRDLRKQQRETQMGKQRAHRRALAKGQQQEPPTLVLQTPAGTDSKTPSADADMRKYLPCELEYFMGQITHVEPGVSILAASYSGLEVLISAAKVPEVFWKAARPGSYLECRIPKGHSQGRVLAAKFIAVSYCNPMDNSPAYLAAQRRSSAGKPGT